jgi:hypothetical protein
MMKCPLRFGAQQVFTYRFARIRQSFWVGQEEVFGLKVQLRLRQIEFFLGELAKPAQYYME